MHYCTNTSHILDKFLDFVVAHEVDSRKAMFDSSLDCIVHSFRCISNGEIDVNGQTLVRRYGYRTRRWLVGWIGIRMSIICVSFLKSVNKQEAYLHIFDLWNDIWHSCGIVNLRTRYFCRFYFRLLMRRVFVYRFQAQEILKPVRIWRKGCRTVACICRTAACICRAATRICGWSRRYNVWNTLNVISN